MTNSIAPKLARYAALPILAAVIAAGALLGTAGAACAAPSISSNDSGNFYAPTIRATPPVLVQPGARWHRQHHRFDFGAE
ncbi:MAG TPA: hypothetical protein VET27_05950 [Mycobacterium sp.]|nr:hypothetical protein [Mycobacterium sp.]